LCMSKVRTGLVFGLLLDKRIRLLKKALLCTPVRQSTNHQIYVAYAEIVLKTLKPSPPVAMTTLGACFCQCSSLTSGM